MMYDPKNYEKSTVEKCPKCGKFVSLEEGYYDRERRDDESSLVVAFCDEVCAERYVRGVDA